MAPSQGGAHGKDEERAVNERREGKEGRVGKGQSIVRKRLSAMDGFSFSRIKLGARVRKGFNNQSHGGGEYPPFPLRKNPLKIGPKTVFFGQKTPFSAKIFSVFGHGPSVKGGGYPLFR